MIKFKALALAAVMAGPVALFATQAQATTILQFVQQNTANLGFTGLNNGNGTTTLSASNLPIFGTYAGSTPFFGFLDFSAISTGTATQPGGPGNPILQSYSGNFSILSVANNSDPAAINYLSGTFVDQFQTFGAGASLSGSTPPATAVTFTSSVIPSSQLNVDRAIALSFSNVNPAQSAVCPGATVCSFSSNVTGTFSANNQPTRVPEPATLMLLGAGLAGIGLVRRRRAA